MARYSGVAVNFTPIVLRSVFRGINTNIRVKLKNPSTTREQLEEAVKCAYVAEDLITVVRDENGEMHGTKDVNDTNAAIIKINVYTANLFNVIA